MLTISHVSPPRSRRRSRSARIQIGGRDAGLPPRIPGVWTIHDEQSSCSSEPCNAPCHYLDDCIIRDAVRRHGAGSAATTEDASVLEIAPASHKSVPFWGLTPAIA